MLPLLEELKMHIQSSRNDAGQSALDGTSTALDGTLFSQYYTLQIIIIIFFTYLSSNVMITQVTTHSG